MAHVLVLDDDPELIDAVKLLLEEEGHAVDARLSRTLEEVVEVDPDVLVIDCPPGGDKSVLNFVQRVRVHPKLRELPVVITTASLRFMEPTLLHTKRIHVLVKPFDADEILEAVRQLAPAEATASVKHRPRQPAS